MRSLIFASVTASLALALPAGLPPASDGDDAAVTTPLRPLAKLAGHAWVGRGVTLGDQPFDVMVAYQWGVGKQVMHAQSYMVKGAEKTLVYESFFAWHPQRKAIVCTAVSSRGDVMDGTVAERDGQLEFEMKRYEGDVELTIRQTFAFGADEYVWTLYQKSGDDWKKLTTTPMKRQPK